ncbi:MAG TPA: porin [Prosthecobacter sp.]|nr:porin [Prosthecobacter sp.]
MRRGVLLGGLLTLWFASVGLAGVAAPEIAATLEPAPEKSWEEAVENAGRIHYDPKHSWVQELWLLGRYHGQYFHADGPADEVDGWEHRRLRLGAQGKFFNKLTLHAQAISGTDFEPRYNGFSELWAQWAFSDAVALTVGQQKHRFTHERTTSSRYLNTMERSLLVNMMGLDYTPAVTLSGKVGRLAYYTGFFSNSTDTDMGRAFTEFEAGWSYLASLTWDLGQALNTDSAYLNVGFLHSEATPNATLLNRYENAFSSALILTDGPCSLIAEGLYGVGSANGDAAGLMLQPGYFITDRLQVVARYQLAGSTSATGLSAQRRYERPAGLNRGDLYQAGYAGLNFYIAKHRAKVMAGVEYARLGGDECWTAMTGVRIFWGPHSSGPFPMAKVLKAR